MNDRLDAIRKRHADIPQDALPLDIPDVGKPRERDKTQKSVEQARCPWHTGNGTDLTGLIRTASFGLVFREHQFRIGKTTVRCPGSGRSPIEEKETA